MADEYAELRLTGTLEGVTVLDERAVIPLGLLALGPGEGLTNLIRQNVLKLVPTLGVRNAELVCRRAVEAMEARAGVEDDG